MAAATVDFQSVHKDFRPRVLRYLSRLVGEAEAEDLTQSVMLKISEALPGFRGDSSLSTWIYRIATNAALDKRASSRLRHLPRSTSNPSARRLPRRRRRSGRR